MIPTGDKVFMWHGFGYGKSGILYCDEQMRGPYYTSWQENIGRVGYYHDLEELLKLPVSNTLKKRLSSAREGTVIKMHHLDSSGDLAVRRLTAQELADLREMESLKKHLGDVGKEIYAMTEPLQEVLKGLRQRMSNVRSRTPLEYGEDN